MAKVKRKTKKTSVYKVTLSEDEAVALATLLYLTQSGGPLDDLYMGLLYNEDIDNEDLYVKGTAVIEAGKGWRWMPGAELLGYSK